MSEEKPVESSESQNIEISKDSYKYMLEQLDKDYLISMLLQKFGPGEPAYDIMMKDIYTNLNFRKIFVFDMSYDVTEEKFAESFAPFGKITDHKIITDPVTNKSRGFGFIVYEDPVSALKAFEAGVILDGRSVQMKYANAKLNAPKYRKEETATETAEPPKDSRKVHVSGFPIEWTNENMLAFFQSYGEIEEAFICYEKGTHKSRGFGFVTFAKKKDYDECIKEPTKHGEGFDVICSKVSLQQSEDRKRQRVDYDRRDDRRRDDYRDDRRRDDYRDDRRRDDRRYDRRDDYRRDDYRRDDYRRDPYYQPPGYDNYGQPQRSNDYPNPHQPYYPAYPAYGNYPAYDMQQAPPYGDQYNYQQQPSQQQAPQNMGGDNANQDSNQQNTSGQSYEQFNYPSSY